MAHDSSTFDLSQYRIGGHDAFYIPNFVTAQEEEYLTRKITESPQPRWKKLAKRRLQIWGGEISSKGTLIEQPLPTFIDKTPDIISRIKATGAFQNSPHKCPNHVIMNEYLPGQGIMPHEDGPQYYPVVATISLGSHSVFHYYQYRQESNESDSTSFKGKSINETPVLSVLLEPRSLIISSGSMYTSYLHGIDEIEEDIIKSDSNATGVEIANLNQLWDKEMLQTIQIGSPLKRKIRYSLTCRDVERVFAIGNNLFRH